MQPLDRTAVEVAHASLAVGIPRDDLLPDAPDPLAETITRGKQLVLSAALVGDPEDFDIWWRRSRAWTAHMGDSLAQIYGEESARTFQDAIPPSPKPGGWQLALAAELKRAEEILHLLETLVIERADTRRD